jgi:hypothetical protein
VAVSKKKDTQLQDLAVTFVNMQKAKSKFNPVKCVFGVSRVKCWAT